MRNKLLLLVLLLPLAAWAHPKEKEPHCDLERPDGRGGCRAVAMPEGGSTIGYLAISGLLVAGVIAVKRRQQQV